MLCYHKCNRQHLHTFNTWNWVETGYAGCNMNPLFHFSRRVITGYVRCNTKPQCSTILHFSYSVSTGYVGCKRKLTAFPLITVIIVHNNFSYTEIISNTFPFFVLGSSAFYLILCFRQWRQNTKQSLQANTHCSGNNPTTSEKFGCL